MGCSDVSKPEDIPQDVWATSVKVELVVEVEFTDLRDWNSRDVATEVIARAIMAERERCAKIAGDYPTTRMIDGPQIATRIRKGTT
jgi:hypothetical protein